jgi:isoleucyl-tRNA synthetase
VKRCVAHYQGFEFHKVYQAIYGFATTELSSIYFDVAKDRLYTSGVRSASRRSAQTALYRINDALVRLLAPILSFTSEEVWRFSPGPASVPRPSVHVGLFPLPEELTAGLSAAHRAADADWDRLLPVREQVLKSLETARQDKIIGAPLEASVSLRADASLYPLLKKYEKYLPGLFIVSRVDLFESSVAALEVSVDRARGEKCERCWKYVLDLGADPEMPTICGACAAAVRENMLDGLVSGQ